MAPGPRREVAFVAPNGGRVTACKRVGREINEVCVADVETRHLRPCFHFTAGETYENPVPRTEIAVRRQTRDKYRNCTRQLRVSGPIDGRRTGLISFFLLVKEKRNIQLTFLPFRSCNIDLPCKSYVDRWHFRAILKTRHKYRILFVSPSRCIFHAEREAVTMLD